MRSFGIIAFMALATALPASAQDEFKVKRQEVFEFTQKPTVTRRGDRVEIAFASKAYCDVTVVVENADGRIIRHLVSGVLGDKAPPPLQKNSLRQALIWDGKDDKGSYVDDKDRCQVRVSLGLQARFERALYWEPKKRTQQEAVCTHAAPEGVYVSDGRVIDHVRLFGHDGNYVRTVYPFPADKLREVKGLHWHKFPQDGAELPLKEGFHQATLLSSGNNAGFDEKLGIGVDRHNNYHGSVWGNAASCIAVRGSRMAVARLRLNRLATDGSTGGLDLTGPEVQFPIRARGNLRRNEEIPVAPHSAAFSPDGKWLYLTGYIHAHGEAATRDIVLVKGYDWLPGVARVDFAAGTRAEVFLGGMKLTDAGTGDGRFQTPTSVSVDSAGRLYVSDYASNRIQVFDPEGKHLKNITIAHPAQVVIHQRTQEIWVFSWTVPTVTSAPRDKDAVTPRLTILKSFADPKPVLTCPFPIGPMPSRCSGPPVHAEVDSWADPPVIWATTDWGRLDIISRDHYRHPNVKLWVLQDGQLKEKRDFNEEARKSVVRIEAAEYSRQRLHVDEATGTLYLSEGQAAAGKSFRDLVRIDPETGAIRIVPLPFDAEDMCFDPDGRAYLRTFYLVARYDPRDWTEVPFDYGEEHNDVRTSSSRDARPAKVVGALRLPVKNAGLHHHGGMAVSSRGHLVVAVNNHGTQAISRKDIYETPVETAGKPYVAPAFPGRVRWGEIHVWDRHGQMLHEDAVPGQNRLDGLAIDRDDNVYLMSTTTRILNGQRYFNDMTETLIKVLPKKVKVMSPSERAVVPLSGEAQPKRSPDVANAHVDQAWVEGAEWFYGGVGFAGKNAARSGGGCDCYNARFALDYLGRSFAPEVDHYSVAVLDTAGNLILRVGRYGNADSAGPQSRVPLDGDGVGLFCAPYVATHTDRRLFIADPGNARVVSVRLGYHQSETVKLKDVPDQGNQGSEGRKP